MTKSVAAAFQMKGVKVPLERILPLKRVQSDLKRNAPLRRIMSSIEHVGLIEPLVVHPQPGTRGSYTLLDGHLRLEALKHLGWREAPCLLSTDDEAYTYNHKVNVIPPLQEHYMIMTAIESGVSEAKIAASLNVDVATIRQKRDLLNGICPEAVELLKDKQASRDMFRVLRKVKPLRQIEMAELMISAGNYTTPYAKCLLAATADELLVNPAEGKSPLGTSPEDAARMEREMQRLEHDLRAIEDSHAKNVLNLVLTTGYLRKLLDNGAVSKFLSGRYADMRVEFQKLVEAASLDR